MSTKQPDNTGEALRRIDKARRSKAIELDLSNLNLTSLPDSLFRLTNLESLYLHTNQISAIPDSLAQLANLHNLNLRDNQIAAIPNSLAKLTTLQYL